MFFYISSGAGCSSQDLRCFIFSSIDFTSVYESLIVVAYTFVSLALFFFVFSLIYSFINTSFDDEVPLSYLFDSLKDDDSFDSDFIIDKDLEDSD